VTGIVLGECEKTETPSLVSMTLDLIDRNNTIN
jgi:hypothetical protein